MITTRCSPVRSVVVIPSIGCSDKLAAVVRAALSSHAQEVVVIENQAGDRHVPTAEDRLRDAELKDRVTYVRSPEIGLYAAWNAGLDVAKAGEDGPSVAVVLNDDIIITPWAIDALIEALDAHRTVAVVGADYEHHRLASPQLRYVSGTYRAHGVPGFAFACRADVCRVDEQFEWWGGDDDLVFSARQAGWRCAVLMGAHVDHPVPETSAARFPELGAAKDRDRERLKAKWGETW